MVDPGLVDVSKLDVETKRRIVLYVVDHKKVSPSSLGYSASYIYKIRRGLAQPSDELVRRCLQYLTPEEYVQLTNDTSIREATIADIIRVIKRAIVDAQFRDMLLNYLEKYLGEHIRRSARSYVATSEDIDRFIKHLKAQRLAKDTINRHIRYLKRFLARSNNVLNPEIIREVLTEIEEDYGKNVLRHTVKALKKFIKTIIWERDPAQAQVLYNSFKTIRPSTRHTRLDFTIEDLRKVWQELPTLESKLYFTILVECGLRPGEPFLIKLSNIDWNLRVVWFETEEESTKRRYITFLREETIRWIRETYLPYRDRFVKQYYTSLRNLGYGDTVIKNWEDRLIPFDRGRLRREIKETFRKVLGKEIELYDLRKFWSTWMTLRGVPGQIIDILQGRTPPKEFEVLMRHYVTIGSGSFILELRKWYDNHAPKIVSTQSSPGPFSEWS